VHVAFAALDLELCWRLLGGTMSWHEASERETG
jgi:hypothetical protein